jgi:hypothetical protein
MRIVLDNNAGRVGEILTEEERMYVNELVVALKNIDPIVPATWKIVSANGAVALTSTVGGDTLRKTLAYEPNGNIIGTTDYVNGALDVTYSADYDAANRVSNLKLDGILLASYYEAVAEFVF